MNYTQIEQIKEKLKQTLPERTYAHTLRTVEMAMELCVGTNADRDTVFLAALLHDCAKKDVPNEAQLEKLADFANFPKVIHAPLGAIKANEEYGILSDKVLDCIRFHTTGRPNMSIEEMIVFLADAIEDGRTYDNVDKIREKTKSSIIEGVLASLEGVVLFEEANGNEIHHLTKDTIEFLKGE